MLVVALLTTVALAGPVMAGDAEDRQDDRKSPSTTASQTQEGWVMVPSHPSARMFSASTLEGITHEVVDVVPGAPFTLKGAFGSEAGTCLLAACAETSDFDIVFMMDTDGGSTLLLRAANVGDETGTVPPDASLGVVYLRTPGLVPEIKGYRFEYSEEDADA